MDSILALLAFGAICFAVGVVVGWIARREVQAANWRRPATDRQKNLIAKLADERELTTPNLDAMSREDASAWIDTALARPRT